ncbi:RNA recognition domain-containing protein [Plectosphaerella plurivora]|uniref:RNA recognition domain-containing protein n=1 Tax=Plectosphaerella plurivora TaxID=936078 RepID=A0A9P9AAS1_9PEZI|nr:RNA recognition domain-containing protein [Plectosphaerella plurivora]
MADQIQAPEVEATAADLSPVSPSPLHSAVSVALPALQDTADLLDTMTEMQSPLLQTAVPVPVTMQPAAGTLPNTHQSEGLPATVAVTNPTDDRDDDVDSLDDPYGEQDDGVASNNQAQPSEQEAGDDDYLKSFDSPAQETQEDGVELSSPHAGAPMPSGPDAVPTGYQQRNGDISISSSGQVGPRNGAPTSYTSASSAAPGAKPSHVQQPDDADNAEVDISRLVAEMAGQADHTPSGPQDAPSGLIPTPSSLPPRPPMPQQAAATSDNTETYQQQLQGQSLSAASFVTGGASGASIDTSRLPPPPTGPAASFNGSQPGHPSNPTAEYERAWQQFTDDERRYMAEANWDKFPEGTRIFIGNLSSERVSKRDVFDLFYVFGRLAQISLKSAYGFVQYHHVDEANGAMHSLQNAEIKGRKIHLEISKIQKKKGREGRESRDEQSRASDRGGGGRNGRDAIPKGPRSDISQNRRGREDPRSGRGHSPRRNRDDKYGRDRGYQESQSRGRSRTPEPYGRQPEQYRRRSPSPPNSYGRGPMTEDQLQIPRRYGSQVPDVQFLLLQEVGRDFVEWVERAFTSRGLKVEVMFLNPNFPRDAVIQRQVVEGVHGIVDLDMRAHSYGKIPLRVFDRSGGTSARYDDYQDLDPNIAAELIGRAKSQAQQAQAQAQYHHASQPPPQPAYGAGGYGQRYPPHHNAPQHHQAYPPGPPTHAPPAQNGGQSDMERVLAQFGNIDGATLQQLVAAVQASQQAPQGAQPQNTQSLDINAILSSLNGSTASAAPAPASYAPPAYSAAAQQQGGGAHVPQQHAQTPVGMPSDSASQVNTIMAQLAKFRQQ